MKLGKKVLVIALTVAALSTTVVGTALAAQGDTPAQGQNTQTTQANRPAWTGVARGAAGSTVNAVTDLLDMTATDIQTARQQGESLSEIATDKGISLDSLVGTIVAQRKALLDKVVADGRITQDQAELMLTNMTARITERVQDPAVGPRSDRPAAGQRGAGMGTGINCPVTAG